jgi:two-component system NtrC family response regulator
MELLRRIRSTFASHEAARAPGTVGGDIPVIVLTAHGTVEQAVEAMKLGAFTYLLKPVARDELILTVQQALRTKELAVDNRNLRRLLRQKAEQPALIYRSEAMKRLMELVHNAAASDVSVLLTGESGTGKELIARACHDLSARWDRPFVAVSCGALPDQLIESELFGHTKGAFTGADRTTVGRIGSAAGGTLFLDEIAELPLALQPKLLRVLETKQVDPVGGSAPVTIDFRLVCATNRNLEQAAAEGTFREDLFYRLAILHVHLPPLRDRREDIAPLWEHFSRLHGGPQLTTTPALMQALAQRRWRGNVRELRNLNQRLVLMRKSDRLTEADLAAATVSPATGSASAFDPATRGRLGDDAARSDPGVRAVDEAGAGAADGLPLLPLPDAGFSLIELEAEIIRRALDRHGGNKSRTAAYLGIPRHVLVYRLAKYKI